MTAVGSRSIDRANAFLDEFIDADFTLVKTYVKTYGSYAEVYNDPVCRAFRIYAPPPLPVSSADIGLLGRGRNLHRSVVVTLVL